MPDPYSGSSQFWCFCHTGHAINVQSQKGSPLAFEACWHLASMLATLTQTKAGCRFVAQRG